MTEWNLGTTNNSSISLQSPDNITSMTQLNRIVRSYSRPSVIVNERELSVLRRGLTKDGWKRSLYLQPGNKHILSPYEGSALLSTANQWLETEIQVPEAGGYWDRLFCDCGARLDLLGREDTSYVCEECGKQWSGADYIAALKYVQHIQLSSAALCTALVYGIEKDRVYADKSAEILVKYAEAYPKFLEENEDAGILRDPDSEAKWVIPLAQAYDLLYYSRSLTDENKDDIEKNLFQPVAERLKDSGVLGSKGAWQLSAVGVIGLSMKDASLINCALENFRLQVRDQLGDDGLWPESVHSYHFSTLSAYVHLAEACYRVGIDIYNWQVRPDKSLKQMFLAPLHYMMPSLRLPAINDGWYDSFLPLDLYEIAHRRWDDPAFAWVLKKGYKLGESPLSCDHENHSDKFRRSSFYAFMFGRDLPGRSGIPAIKSENFADLGICSLRNDDNLVVTFDYGPCQTDGHRDKLSFTLFANNEMLVPDYGDPDSSSDMHKWYSSTAAHNTVVVDGRSQEPAFEYGLINLYSGSMAQFAEGTASDCYPGVTHNRKIVLFGGACVIVDELKSDREHDYDWAMHCEGEPEVGAAGEYSEADCSSYRQVQIDKSFDGSHATQMNWRCKDGDLHFNIWNLAEKSSIVLGKCPAETVARQSSFFMSRQHGFNAKFVAAFVPAIKDTNVDISMTGSVVTLSSNDEFSCIYIRGFENGSSEHPLTTDAEIATVHMCGDEVTAIGLIKGSWVKWNDELLVESSSEADCIEVSFEERNPAIKYCGNAAGAVKLKTAARAMRVNGYRAAASSFNGHAVLRVTSQMLQQETPASRH